jgi:hypothetical protein
LAVEDPPVSDNRPARQEAAVAIAVPAMPQPQHDTLWRTPYLIQGVYGLRYAVGWQDSKKDGPCFVVVRISAFGGEKVLERFPLTADGWTQAWATLVNRDASAAQPGNRRNTSKVVCWSRQAQGRAGPARRPLNNPKFDQETVL